MKIKEILMIPVVIIAGFLLFSFYLCLSLIFFLPVLPIMLLAFPMTFMNYGTDRVHWSQKPYLWYFDNVWLKVIHPFLIL
jgi:hypothetical protein